MNKKINIILAALLAVAGVFSMTSCDDDEPNVAKAVLCNVFSLDYTAEGSSQEVKVVSDAQWHVEAPDWITVEPATGSGTTFVTIKVSENYREGTPDVPRKADVVFKGNTKASEAVVAVRQDGDLFRGVSAITAKEFYDKANEEAVIISNMTVVTVYSTGFVATDGTTNVNAVYGEKATAKPAVGETVTVYGTRDTDKYGMAYVLFYKSEKGGIAATAPAAVEIDLDDFSCSTVTAVTFTGVYNPSGSITDEEKTNAGFTVAAADGIDLEALEGHKITVTAYCLGVVPPAVNVIIASCEDHGPVVYWSGYEDFEWLAGLKFVNDKGEAQVPGKTVETDDLDASAPNLYGTFSNGVSIFDMIESKGYKFIYDKNDPKRIYYQENYLKFGKTGNHAGIIIPAMREVPEGHLYFAFDWCPMRQGSGKIDPVNLIVDFTTGDKVTTVNIPTHGWENGHALEWIHTEVDLADIEYTNRTTITIRQQEWEVGTANRWFLDNIKIITK